MTLRLIFLLFTFTLPIYTTELIFKSGDAFICDVVEENDRILKIKFKDKMYDIPKSEIQMRDNKKTGTHKEYTLSTIQLLDGTIVKGNIAEETEAKFYPV